MKSFAIIFLIVAILASIAFSVPTNNDYCHDLELIKPKDGIIYEINSTQIVEVDKSHCYDQNVKITLEVFSIGAQAVVDTIIEQEYLYQLPQQTPFLIDKVWANDGAKYFVIATIFKGDYHSKIVAKSGTFTTVDKL